MDELIATRSARRHTFASKLLPNVPAYLTEIHKAKGGSLLELTLLLLVLTGLVLSAALAGEYLYVPRFCRHGGGCEKVRNSPYAALFGIPTPILGIMYFFGVLVVTVQPFLRRHFLLPVGAAGAIFGFVFLMIQAFVLHAFCPLCVMVDITSLVVGTLVWMKRDVHLPKRNLRQQTTVGVVGFLLVCFVLFVHVIVLDDPHMQVLSKLPPEIEAEQVKGKVTIVEFFDFFCGNCVAQYRQMTAALDDFDHQINLVYKHLPQAKQKFTHAARVMICTEQEEPELVKPMIAALFGSSPSLDKQTCIVLAERVGVKSDRFMECLQSANTSARIRKDSYLAEDLGVHDVPIFWIGREKFVGLTTAEEITASILRELHRMDGK